MKNTPLSDLRKKGNAYFRNLGIVQQGRRRKSTIEYIVRRSFEALPKNLKAYIENPEQAIKVITHTIIADGKAGKMKPYEALKQLGQYRKRQAYGGTIADAYRRLKEEEPSVYSHYNTYVYRLGYSASAYFMQNAKAEVDGKYVTITVDLPNKPTGKAYDKLWIEFSYSDADDYFEAEMI